MSGYKETEYYRPGMDNTENGRYLIIIDANGNVREIELDPSEKMQYTFGRDPALNDIAVASAFVSGVHGVLELSENQTWFTDLGSKNGTIVEMDGSWQYLKGNTKALQLRNGAILRVQSAERSQTQSVLILYAVRSCEGTWHKHTLTEGTTTIGRDRENDIVLPGPCVSRFHAEIACSGGEYYITDKHSLNGVLVNGKTLGAAQKLREKDVIQILQSTLLYSGGMLFYKHSAKGVNLEAHGLNKIVWENKSILKRKRKCILRQVSCEIKSDEFVAIIGGSGAGKTTLMNAMNGFDSKAEGEVYCNHIDLREHFNELKALIAYVPQQDIIFENLSLYKMLQYTAKLKMPDDTSTTEIEGQIDKVLQMVELSTQKGTLIRKLSGGQKKRASIAVELLSDPSLFFLDEPTSGLDPWTEKKLMQTLSHLAKSEGKTIVMVTHTTQNLDLCDKVIFMGQGGRLCFCGTTEQAKMFFDTDDLVEIYDKISENSAMWEEQYRNCMEQESMPKPADKKIPPARKRCSWLRQMGILTSRYAALIRNDAPRMFLLLLQPVIITLLLDIVASKNAFKLYEGTKSILFSLSCAGIWIGLFNSIQEICKERVILKREYMNNLKLSAYIISKFLVQILIGAVQAGIMVAIFVSLVGKPEKGLFFDNASWEMLITLWLTIQAAMALGFLISSLVKSGDKAMTAAPFVLIVQLLFSGILFSLKGIGKKIANVTVSKWSVSGLGSIADLNQLQLNIQKKIPTAEHKVESIFEATRGHLGEVWVILFVMVAVCGLVSVIVLRRVSADSR